MSTYTDGPTHAKAAWRRPTYINGTLADPLRFPRVQRVRSSCGHTLGASLVWRRQRVVLWAVCR